VACGRHLVQVGGDSADRMVIRVNHLRGQTAQWKPPAARQCQRGH
jgi:hypothetical protein